MGTVFRNPNWLMPNNSNRDKVANYSLYFDASSGDYISTTDLRLGNTYSISLWFKANSFPSTNPALISQYVNAAAGRFFIGVRDNGGRKITVFSAGHNYGSTTISTDTWYNVILVNNNNTATLYLNGSIDGNFTFSSAPPDTNILLGALDTTPNNPWDGQICQVCIFDYALQPSDITTLYGNATDGVGDPLSLTTKPVAYYPLDDELFWNNSQFIAPNSVINTGDKLGGICVANTNANGRTNGLAVSPGSITSQFDDIPLDGGVGGSCSFWFKWTQGNTTGWSYLSNNGSGAGSPFNWRIRNSDGNLYYHGTGSANTGTAVTKDQWHNITITCSPFDGANTTVKAYLDGTLFDTRTAAFGAAALAYLGGILTVTDGNWTRFVNLATFTKELSQSEVTSIYNNGEPIFLLTHDSINTYYPLTRDFVNILNGALVITNALTSKFNVQPGSWSASSVVTDYPTQQASGLVYNISQDDVKGDAPYSIKNIASNNGERSQLLPFGAGRINVSDPTKFTITVDTRITDSGSTNTSTFQLPLSQNSGNEANVNWGDGTTSTGLTANTEHVYSSPGVYQITVEAPSYIQSAYKNGGYGVKDQMKIISVDAFGSSQNHHTSSNGWYSGCYNLDIKALDAPNFYTNAVYTYPRMANMFQSTQGLINENKSLSLWTWPVETGGPQNMFKGSYFNNDAISNWDLSNIGGNPGTIIYSGCFSGARFFNQPINWNAPNVTSFSSMFTDADSFNQDVTGFDFSQSTNNSFFLYTARNFNNGGQPMDNITFNANCSNMTYFMRACTVFNQDVSNWTMPTTTTNYAQMFYGCGAFQGTGMNTWSTSGPISGLNLAFGSCLNFNGDISWMGNLANNANITRAFENTYVWQGTGLKTNWNIQDANPSLYRMFYFAGNTGSVLNVDLSSWDVSNITNLREFMSNAGGSPGDISSWDVSNVTTFRAAFIRCANFNVNLNNWDFSSATTLRQMLFQIQSYNQPILWQLGNNTTDLNQTFYSTGTGGGGATQDRWTDTVVNFAVKAYNNSGQPSGVTFSGQNNQPTIDTSQTQTENSVNYSTFYGTEWPSGWSNAGDAVTYLSGTLNWSGL